MKLQYILIAVLLSYTCGIAQLKIPNLSPSATAIQKIGLTTAEINYYRPSARGRTVFGNQGLLPFGEMWRTGANNATKITFSDPVFISKKPINAGSYTIITTPREKDWQIQWYPYESTNWNSYINKEAIISINIPVEKTNSYKESLSIHFEDITLESANLNIHWANTRVKIPITVDEKESILKSIDKTLAGPSPFDYFRAAVYLHETKTDLALALKYIQKVTNSDKALFFQVTREALILKDLGKNKEAKQIAKRGLELSKKAKNNDFIRLNQNMIETL